MAHYFPYDVKLRILAHSRSFLANQEARNALFGAENLLNKVTFEGSDKIYIGCTTQKLLEEQLEQHKSDKKEGLL